MKKFYAIIAAALMSVSVFASKDVVPSDAVLADYYEQGNVCMCFFVPAEMNCNDIVVTGSFNGWKSTIEDCVAVEAVEGFDGWYVASFAPEEEPDPEKGIQAKPIMLDVDGKFNWDYQVGAATAIRGGVTVVQGGYEGEIDLINYGVDAPNVFAVDGWKQNPCDAVYHNYKFTVISDGCDGYVLPFIVGAFTNWSFVQMTYDVNLSLELGADVYVYNVKAAENSPYQFVTGLWDDEGGIAVEPAWVPEAYLQKLIDEQWVRIPGESGDNLLTHEDANITFDVRAEDLRWARCAPAEDPEVVAFAVRLPAENCPEAVEVIGTFDGWAGTALTWNPSTGFAEAIFEAKPSDYFKFRGAGSWDQELELYNEAEDTWAKIGDNQLVFKQLWEDAAEGKSLVLDFSDPEKARWTGGEQGIENITLTEDAHKVIVDGVLYIVRDNKMFNVQGAQVR